MKRPKPIELSLEDRQKLIERIKNNMTSEDAEILTGIIDFNSWLQYSLEQKKISINKLQKIFGSTSEKNLKKKKESSNKNAGKKADEAGEHAGNPSDPESTADLATENADHDSTATPTTDTNARKYVPNNGRLGHDKYTNAEIIYVSAPCKPGDPCLEEKCKGTLKITKPGCVIKIVGQSFAKANKYILETLRCNLCEKYFSDQLPQNICDEKYDAAFKAQLCIHKYYLGIPNNRLAVYQQFIGIPLPSSTQFDKTEEVANDAYPAFKHLEKLAANGHLMHGDDTSVRIQSIIKANKNLNEKARVGTFTTGLISFNGKNKIHLFYSGRQHCGENILALLSKRDPNLPLVKYMCDALPANMPKGLKALIINCLIHGRRNFVDIEKFYSEECEFVLNIFSMVYKHEKEANEQKLNDEERLIHHQTYSKKPMEDLHLHCKKQLDEHIVEKNSPLGHAYNYMLKHWDKLTRFLHIAGAPLDNNTLEQALKIPIRVRKNSYFYATEHGAYIGSMLQSLICTCIAANQNPVEYLTVLQVHKLAVRRHPDEWMPWNYKDTISKILAESSAKAQAA